MLDWIIDNKEWLFSGLGISLFILFVWSLKFFFFPAPERKNQKEEKVSYFPFDITIYKDRPYPSEITSEINKIPPLQQAAKQECYRGLKVGWLTTFETAHEPNVDGKVSLMLLDRGNYPWVYCKVDLNKYPELKIAHKKTKIWVAGEIIKVSKGGIELQTEDLKLQ